MQNCTLSYALGHTLCQISSEQYASDGSVHRAAVDEYFSLDLNVLQPSGRVMCRKGHCAGKEMVDMRMPRACLVGLAYRNVVQPILQKRSGWKSLYSYNRHKTSGRRLCESLICMSIASYTMVHAMLLSSTHCIYPASSAL